MIGGLANVIRSWQVSQDIENIRVIKFCFVINRILSTICIRRGFLFYVLIS